MLKQATTTYHITGRDKPDLPITCEDNPAYYVALKLVTHIDKDLTRQTGHYYDLSACAYLSTLDEVVRAILNDSLLTPERADALGVLETGEPG